VIFLGYRGLWGLRPFSRCDAIHFMCRAVSGGTYISPIL